MASTPFSCLVADLQSARVVGTLDACGDHAAAGSPEEPDSIEIDLAPFLGLDPAPHRVLTYSALSAVQFFRMTESAQKLARRKQVEGWPQALVHDVALLCALHSSPTVEGSGLAMGALYEPFASRPALIRLWMYLIERAGRAWPSLVRPEIALEIHYNDLRRMAIEAQLAKGAESPEAPDPPEAPEPPTTEEVEQVSEELGLLPTEERHPNDSAP